MAYDVRYRRVYTALKRFGFSALKALEIVVSAKRRDGYAFAAIRVARQHGKG